MLKTPKKQSEIMIVGTGDLASAVTSYLMKKGRKVTRIADPSSVHFLGVGLASNGSEKVGFKRALVILPTLTELPRIKGLPTATYSLTSLAGRTAKNLKHIILGSGPASVDAALIAIQSGSQAEMVYRDALLDSYDVSVQDAVRRHLKSLRVGVVTGYSVLACVTKGARTSLLLKNKSDTKQITCDRLLVEPVEKKHSDMGLTNLNLSISLASREIKKNVMLVSQKEVFDLNDIKRLGDILDKNKGTLSERTYTAHSVIQNAQLFSYGLLEQDISSTHHAYQRSIARSNDTVETFHGFLKVLANKQGEILSISGILPASYQNVHVLRYAVKHHLKVSVLLGMLDVGDPLMDELMEVAREIR